MNFQLFAENLHAKFQKVEGRKCITYIVLHPISVKPNKSQQFHEKMYTIQELNCMCIHISNLFMSFSKKITGILCKSSGGKHAMYKLNFFPCITSSKKARHLGN